ncbi:MAG: hypothetical protein KGS72_16570 [Cyanobacteria bacterium REEB67]|jgi:hypothetical protein|nr:hypothetical protein [Cyanobacteria bacterium REEB67]
MPSNKEQKKAPWVNEAIQHLAALLHEATDLADEDDTLPTKEALAKGTEVLKSFSHASVPQIGVSTNGDFVITWKNHGDAFKVFVRPSAEVLYFRNKNAVHFEEFSKFLTAVPA